MGEAMILRRGGGSDLAIRVMIGTVQPAGAAGMLWVDTALASDRWTAAVAEPGDPASGDLWIQTDAISSNIINLLKRNAAMINVLRVKQYNGAKWESVAAYFHDGTGWTQMSYAFNAATDITYTGTSAFVDEGNGNWHLSLTTSGTLEVTNPLPEGAIDILLIGGGGSGGFSQLNAQASGGGGAGGKYDEMNVALGVGTYPAVVGAGGAATTANDEHGNDGGNTTFNGLTAYGGGGGGRGGVSPGCNGNNGGCGGGGTYQGGSGGTGSQGGNGANYPGGTSGGGGGGAGGDGSGSSGGVAYTSSITGASVEYAGGGGGAVSGSVGTRSNTYGGGGAGNYGNNAAPESAGKAGIIIIRNHRQGGERVDYAIVENGVVTNVICINQGNAQEFPGAVPIVEVPAGIGDTYSDGAFFRDDVRLLTPLEEAREAIGELDAAVVEYAYQNALLTLGVPDEEVPA